jgi:hypothetical protein
MAGEVGPRRVIHGAARQVRHDAGVCVWRSVARLHKVGQVWRVETGAAWTGMATGGLAGGLRWGGVKRGSKRKVWQVRSSWHGSRGEARTGLVGQVWLGEYGGSRSGSVGRGGRKAARYGRYGAIRFGETRPGLARWCQAGVVGHD